MHAAEGHGGTRAVVWNGRSAIGGIARKRWRRDERWCSCGHGHAGELRRCGSSEEAQCGIVAQLRNGEVSAGDWIRSRRDVIWWPPDMTDKERNRVWNPHDIN